MLTENFTPEKITRIEITGDSSPVLTLEKTEAGRWKLPGNWPLRKQEVAELVALFSDLRTRFQAIPIDENEDLTRLWPRRRSIKPIIVKVTAAGTPYKLAFGEPKLAEGESSFTRSCLSPHQRQSRTAAAGSRRDAGAAPPSGQLSPPATLPRIRTHQARPGHAVRRRHEHHRRHPHRQGEGDRREVRRPRSHDIRRIDPRSESYVLKRVEAVPQAMAAEKGAEPTVPLQRIADAWEIVAPQRDRIDADKLEKILTTIPDLWVEEFATDAAKAGLDKPDRTITVTRRTARSWHCSSATSRRPSSAKRRSRRRRQCPACRPCP